MRFVVGPGGVVHFPIDFFRTVSVNRPPAGARRPVELPPAQIEGVTSESVGEAAQSGDMNDLLLPDGDPPFEHCDRVTSFGYELLPTPAVTLVVADGEFCFRFTGARIVDWTTEAVAAQTPPELCDFHWDGKQHFLLSFIAFHVILQTAHLTVERASIG